MVCGDNTLVVLADFRLDCGIIDKILQEHTFKHNIWLSFCDNGTVIDEVPRTKGKVFKVTEYIYHLSSINEEDVTFIKEAVLSIKNGVLDDSHNNPDSNSPTVRLKTTYRLTVEQNGISKKVRGEWGNKEEATGIGLRLYKNHSQDDYLVFLVTVLRFPMYDGTAREMSFPSKIENITESKTNKNMKKNVVRINENTLRQIVAESVKRMLKENNYITKRGYENHLPVLLTISFNSRFSVGYLSTNITSRITFCGMKQSPVSCTGGICYLFADSATVFVNIA